MVCNIRDVDLFFMPGDRPRNSRVKLGYGLTSGVNSRNSYPAPVFDIFTVQIAVAHAQGRKPTASVITNPNIRAVALG